MTDWDFRCAGCEAGYRPDHTDYCARCGWPVLAQRNGLDAATPLVTAAPGLWRYVEHLPLSPDTSWLSLGETGTPLVRSPGLAERAGVGAVWLLLDHLEPTGSFKDRAAAAAVAHAWGAGVGGVVCASSGNAAASAAAYAARAGLPAVIVVPRDTPPGKLVGPVEYGAVVLGVPGDYSRSFTLAAQVARRLNFANVATTFVNPHGVAALRSVAFDLVGALGDGPDAVHVPTSAGPLVHGVAAGFRDLTRLGHTTKVPRMDADQPAGCAPVALAYRSGATEVRPWPEVTTTISGVNDPLRGYASDGSVTLREVRETGGHARALPDEEILSAQRLLAREHGIFVEPAAATSVAGLLASRRGEHHGPDDTVVCLLTGNGLKTATVRGDEIPAVTDVQQAVDVLADRGVR